MRHCVMLLVVALLTSCASAPKMGEHIGACQVTPTIIYKSDEGRQRVCTPGDTGTWRKLLVHYSAHSGYSGTTNSSDNFYAPPGQECADMPTGLIPSAVDSCERYAAQLFK